jgi:transposase
MFNDEFCSKLSPILQNIGIYAKRSLRLTIEAIPYRLRVGHPWRDIPKELGDWNKIYKRFNHWSRYHKFKVILKTSAKDPDMEWKLMDASIIKVH